METQQVTLTEFLLARIAEDESEQSRWLDYEPIGADRAVGIDECMQVTAERNWFTRRVNAECEAKRRVIAFARHLPSVYGWSVLEPMALPYIDHPDWREEWRG